MNKIIHVDKRDPKVETIRGAVHIIKNGGVIVYPTDTVYGLGANALNPNAILKVFKIKDRPLNQPLPVAVSGLKMAEGLTFFDDKARQLVRAFWPGALTIVLTKRPIVPSIVAGGGLSVGLRMPNHSIPLIILEQSGLPLVATSANKHGLPNPIEAEEALRQVGDEVDLILDGGNVSGQPSTVIDLTKRSPLIVRKGSITRAMIETIVGRVAT